MQICAIPSEFQYMFVCAEFLIFARIRDGYDQIRGMLFDTPFIHILHHVYIYHAVSSPECAL